MDFVLPWKIQRGCNVDGALSRLGEVDIVDTVDIVLCRGPCGEADVADMVDILCRCDAADTLRRLCRRSASSESDLQDHCNHAIRGVQFELSNQ